MFSCFEVELARSFKGLFVSHVAFEPWLEAGIHLAHLEVEYAFGCLLKELIRVLYLIEEEGLNNSGLGGLQLIQDVEDCIECAASQFVLVHKILQQLSGSFLFHIVFCGVPHQLNKLGLALLVHLLVVWLKLWRHK